MRYDVAVIGAGHNGLVAALRLAQSGRKVVVLESRERAGGLCAPNEFHPGYTAPGIWHDTAGLHPRLADELAPFGLTLRSDEVPVFGTAGEHGLLLYRDAGRARAEIAKLAGADADAYARWRAFLGRVGKFVASILHAAPPPMEVSSLSSLWTLGRRGLAMRRLGRDDMFELMRVAPMCVADWLNESFESPLLAEILAGPAVLGSYLGPWSAGSAIQLLFAECTAGREVAGGPAALVAALIQACEKHGVELRTGTRVERIVLGQHGVVAVHTAAGEIDTKAVAATCDPKTALLDLLQPIDLPRRLEEQIRVLRTRGTTAKVHLALDGPLEVAGRTDREAVRVGGGDLDALERAFDAVKYRRYSERPFLDVRVPTVAQPDLAPAGHHVVSILVSFAPRDLDGGWTEAERAALGDLVVDRLAAAAPGVRERIVAREVLTPLDLETDYGLAGGQLHHGEQALDQMLFMRPAPSCAGYATPIPGLWLCGSGSHPGGGVTGVPGMLGSAAMLRP